MPLHTDGAHLRRPPDFTLLEADNAAPGEDTLLYRLRAEDLDDDVRHGVFAVVGNGAPFAAHAIDGDRVRFDPGCMRPRDGMAKRAMTRFAHRVGDAVRYQWNRMPGAVLVIDNKWTLHGRGIVGSGTSRELRRLMLRLPE